LSNEFTVDVPVDRAWEVLTDVPTIAPCLPGAQLQEVEGDEYRGIVKVKVGPITAQYKGKATFVETDGTVHRVVLRAEGRETRGQGNASALITAEMHPEGHRTKVTVSTDLTVTGKVAQFGRGVMADVSAKLMDQFADNLRTTVLADVPADEPVAPPDEPVARADEPVAPTDAVASTNGTHAAADDRPRVRTFDLPEPEPVDLLDAAGTPVLRRALPALGVVLVLGIIVAVLLRRRRG
jgi:uncharacterized protein